jgi:hypothetical protein
MGSAGVERVSTISPIMSPALPWRIFSAWTRGLSLMRGLGLAARRVPGHAINCSSVRVTDHSSVTRPPPDWAPDHQSQTPLDPCSTPCRTLFSGWVTAFLPPPRSSIPPHHNILGGWVTDQATIYDNFSTVQCSHPFIEGGSISPQNHCE